MKKFERCVQHVKKSSAYGRGRVNPWAVCHKSVGRDPMKAYGKSVSWKVSLHGKQIDTVFFTSDMTAEEVKRSLVNHDGYDPRIVVRKQTTIRRDPNSDYEHREIMSFLRDMELVEKAPLAERKEGAAEFARAMASEPRLVAERASWLLDGNYGYGSMLKAKQFMASRGNKEAWLVGHVGAIEWHSPMRMTQAAWKKLTPAQKQALSHAIKAVIHGHATSGDPARKPGMRTLRKLKKRTQKKHVSRGIRMMEKEMKRKHAFALVTVR